MIGKKLLAIIAWSMAGKKMLKSYLNNHTETFRIISEPSEGQH